MRFGDEFHDPRFGMLTARSISLEILELNVRTRNMTYISSRADDVILNSWTVARTFET